MRGGVFDSHQESEDMITTCLACRIEFEIKGGSEGCVAGDANDVCESCWSTIPAQWKILLRLLFDNEEEAGVQLGHVRHTLMEIVEKLFQIHHGHSTFNFCVECDPTAYQARKDARERARVKAKATAKEEAKDGL